MSTTATSYSAFLNNNGSAVDDPESGFNDSTATKSDEILMESTVVRPYHLANVDKDNDDVRMIDDGDGVYENYPSIPGVCVCVCVCVRVCVRLCVFVCVCVCV
jgi:hypothetical protein